MHSRTTKVGEGSTSAKEIATKALKVLSRLARSDTSDEAAKLSHAQSWTDDLVDDLDDDLDDDSEDEFVEDYDDDDWDEPRAALGREPGGVRAIARRDASSLDGRRSGSERGREASRREGERFQLAALGNPRDEWSSADWTSTEQDEDADPDLLDPSRLGFKSRSSKRNRRPRRALDRYEDDDEKVRTRNGLTHRRAQSRSSKSSKRGSSRHSDGGSRRRRRMRWPPPARSGFSRRHVEEERRKRR